jgi:hypothetical protein
LVAVSLVDLGDAGGDMQASEKVRNGPLPTIVLLIVKQPILSVLACEGDWHTLTFLITGGKRASANFGYLDYINE